MLGLDTSLALLLFFCITAALAFEFINGFHDTANVVAKVIYTHTLSPDWKKKYSRHKSDLKMHSASSYLGLPVSTTHVLSSGIAGTMVSGNGVKNLQARTLISIGIAWLITIPVTMLFSGMLFLLLRLLLI